MAVKKRKRAKRRPVDDGRASTSAMKVPPPLVVDEASAAYVKLPVSPEVVAAAREHADNAARLYAMVKAGGSVSVADLLQHVANTGAAIERDVRKLRGR